MMLRNNKGMSLIMVFMAIGMMAGVSLSFLEMTTQATKFENYIDSNHQMNILHHSSETLLTDQNSCRNSFIGADPNGNGQSYTSSGGLVNNNGLIRIQTNNDLDHVRISDIRIHDFTPFTAGANEGLATISIHFDRLGKMYGGNKMVKQIEDVYVQLNALGRLQNCRAQAQNVRDLCLAVGGTPDFTRNPPCQISVSRHPSGSVCGMNVKNQNVQRILVRCQGHDPLVSCPNGFTKEDFGYYEASNGDRHAYYCMKI